MTNIIIISIIDCGRYCCSCKVQVKRASAIKTLIHLEPASGLDAIRLNDCVYEETQNQIDTHTQTHIRPV